VRLAEDSGLVVGVDTHRDTHAAALCDTRGLLVAQLQIPATAAGYVRLLAWVRAAAQGAPITWAVEGTRHYGLGVARHLGSQGQQVAEIDASRHVGRRRAGKSDAIDAVRAARELLARPRLGQLRADGDREAVVSRCPAQFRTIAGARTAGAGGDGRRRARCAAAASAAAFCTA
jgi:transposase